jgi:hypothetical protein
MKSTSLVYVAFGYEYLLMAAHSAHTAKIFNPGIACSLVTNLKLNAPESLTRYFDYVHFEKKEHRENRDAKTRAIEYATFDKGAFIDCDTVIQGDLAPMFHCLDRYDIIVKMDAQPTRKHYQVDENLTGHEFPYWNSGVIFFRRNPQTQKLFSDWRTLFHELGKQSDQPALARAIYENPNVKTLSVNCLWNTFPRDLELLKHKGHVSRSRIWHYRDPRDYPVVARPIMKIHRAITATGALVDTGLEQEVATITNRYRILCSWCYQKNLSRRVLMIALQCAWRFGLLRHLSLNRVRYREGEKFEDR